MLSFSLVTVICRDVSGSVVMFVCDGRMATHQAVEVALITKLAGRIRASGESFDTTAVG
jgi:hypothetical protein